MTIRQAIVEAKMAGYKSKYHYVLDEMEHENNQAVIFLDPLFWQSLGKALDWKHGKVYTFAVKKTIYSAVGKSGDITRKAHKITRHTKEIHWDFEWKRFIDFLAKGKTAEDYFKQLK